ncbi:MAG: dTDP-4-dehydrorhamnose reductase [Hyphomonadaceae bacterium]
MAPTPRVLVTGGAGRLGRALTLASGAAHVALTALPRQQLDVTDDASITAALERFRPDVVINAAAKTHVDECESMAAEVHAVNAIGAERVAIACAAHGAIDIQVSTDFVFGDEGDAPRREEAEPAPVNVYGRTKAEGERLALAVGAHTMVVRTAWLFGDLQDDFIGRLLRAAEGRSRIEVVDDQLGSPTPIASAAEILLRLAKRFACGEKMPRLLHVAGGPPATRADWAREVFAAQRAAGLRSILVEPIPSERYPTAARRPKRTSLDVSRLIAMGEQPPDWRLATGASVGARSAQK